MYPLGLVVLSSSDLLISSSVSLLLYARLLLLVHFFIFIKSCFYNSLIFRNVEWNLRHIENSFHNCTNRREWEFQMIGLLAL